MPIRRRIMCESDVLLSCQVIWEHGIMTPPESGVASAMKQTASAILTYHSLDDIQTRVSNET
jgi:hypothetical protein